jgi:hypothetical protein
MRWQGRFFSICNDSVFEANFLMPAYSHSVAFVYRDGTGSEILQNISNIYQTAHYIQKDRKYKVTFDNLKSHNN